MRFTVEWKDEKGFSWSEEYATREKAEEVVHNLLAEGIKATIREESEKLPSKEIPLLYTQTIQQEITAAIAEEKEAIDDYADLENKLRKSGLNSEADIVTEIRSDEMDHKKKFEALLAGKPVTVGKSTTFYFETTADRDKAREFLGRHNFYFPDGPKISLTDIEDVDYMLELLAYEGFDTSKIQVER